MFYVYCKKIKKITIFAELFDLLKERKRSMLADQDFDLVLKTEK